jgi:hypothetical protein
MPTSTNRRTAIILAENDQGNFAIDLRLNHNPVDQPEVPSLDILTLAVANMIVTADPAIEAAIARVHAAYDDFRINPDSVAACKAFNDAIGIQIYNVEEQKNEDNAS